MTVLWFLQRPERSSGKPTVFVSLTSCHVVVDASFFPSACLVFAPSLSTPPLRAAVCVGDVVPARWQQTQVRASCGVPHEL